MQSRTWVSFLIIAILLALGCGIDQTGLAEPEPSDGGQDVGTDALDGGQDVGTDTLDGGLDSGVDVGTDTPTDTQPDVPETCNCSDGITLACTQGGSTTRTICPGICDSVNGRDPACLDFMPENLGQSFDEIRMAIESSTGEDTTQNLDVNGAVYYRNSGGDCIIGTFDDAKTVEVGPTPRSSVQGMLLSTSDGPVCVFAFENITIVDMSGFRGASVVGERFYDTPPLVLVAFNEMTVHEIDFRGGWSDGEPYAGPGGALTSMELAGGGGHGSASRDRDSGGGGGGFATTGTPGGSTNGADGGAAGATVMSVNPLRPLRGGSAGGKGSRSGIEELDQAGTGGGAVQLVARRELNLGRVLVSGGNGLGGRFISEQGSGSGAGGGSGGGVLLEAPTITPLPSFYIGAAGGGGGAGRCFSQDRSDGGREGDMQTLPPPGGPANGNQNSGTGCAYRGVQYSIGRGGDGDAEGYTPDGAANGFNAGGGGGGAGYVVVRNNNFSVPSGVTGVYSREPLPLFGTAE